ncbi:hypothetical protein JTB14_001301 [Gonioctena quinquepunctata]|nr:hypothetical protein JTB14_001301 [Gonioctena quinquepunctata]
MSRSSPQKSPKSSNLDESFKDILPAPDGTKPVNKKVNRPKDPMHVSEALFSISIIDAVYADLLAYYTKDNYELEIAEHFHFVLG